jgi:hypothetical protein
LHASLYEFEAEPQLNAAFMPQLVCAACGLASR